MCYKKGAVLVVEQVHVLKPGQVREQWCLTRDMILDPPGFWTNAVFSIATNRVPELTAYSDQGAILVWVYRNGEWEIDLPRCKPEEVGKSAYRSWSKVAFEGGRWVLKRSHTEPMPKHGP